MKKVLNKTKLAKRLGVSRPTLYKMIKDGSEVVATDFNLEMQKLSITLSALLCNVAPSDTESLLEFLNDHGFLNTEGQKFHKNYWQVFIKD